MTAAVKTQAIPKALVYEIVDGKPIYYRGYKDVLNKIKTIEEIMASSGLQSLILHYLNIILYTQVGIDKYLFFSNESGVHIKKNKNYAADLAIYEKSKLTGDKINEQYVNIPAKIYIEVDIKADVSEMGETGYIQSKTKSLLDFGAEKVIWILTKPKQVIIAESAQNWEVVSWDSEVELVDGQVFNIGAQLRKEGVI